jgi:hypothetical protein
MSGLVPECEVSGPGHQPVPETLGKKVSVQGSRLAVPRLSRDVDVEETQ